MKRMKKELFEPLDDEEAEIMRLHEEGHFTPLEGEELEKIKAELYQAALNSRASRKLISIRIKEEDLNSLKSEAKKKGLGYQSLINSILHQYVTGQLKAS